MEKAALGFSVHTGWAAFIAATGTLRAPRIVSRGRLELIDPKQRFAYHIAAELAPAEGRRSVARAAAEADGRAKKAIQGIIEQLEPEGLRVIGCGVIASQGTALPFEEIVESHPRIHSAEGWLYRDAIADAARANGLLVRIMSPKAIEAEAMSVLGIPKNRAFAALGRGRSNRRTSLDEGSESRRARCLDAPR